MKVLRFVAFTFAMMAAAGSAQAQLPMFDDLLCSDSGVVAGSELTLFTLYGKQGAGGNSANGNNDDFFPAHESIAGGRYWLGYEMEDGLGMRARYFHWGDDSSYLGLVREQSIKTFDLEATLDMSLYSFDFVGFSGLRWGEVELDGTDFGAIDDYNFEGLGLTVGVDARRLLIGNFSLIGGARYSVLYGENDFGNNASTLDNTFLDIVEFHLGTEWSKNIGRNSRMFASISWEQQVYGTDSYMPNNIDPESVGEVSLAGPVFSIGFDR
jgi:hypothetical protein